MAGPKPSAETKLERRREQNRISQQNCRAFQINVDDAILTLH